MKFTVSKDEKEKAGFAQVYFCTQNRSGKIDTKSHPDRIKNFLTLAAKDDSFCGKTNEKLFFRSHDSSAHVLLLGLGKTNEFSLETLRRRQL